MDFLLQTVCSKLVCVLGDEIPAFKSLYNKFKADDRIVFVGIAVHDEMKNWKKAVDADKPEWIQLPGTQGSVAKNYVATEIPRFIVINKLGNSVDFDAPWPSNVKELEPLLQRESINDISVPDKHSMSIVTFQNGKIY